MVLPANEFLRSLTRLDLEMIRPHLRDVQFGPSAVLYDAGDVIDRLYFPTEGIIALVVVLENGDMVEAGIIGFDGVVGTPAALDGAIALHRAVVQAQGAGLTIDIASMRAAVATSRSLRIKIYEHDQILLAQAQQSAACNAKHEIEARLCRWLLRTLDLVRNDKLVVTQDFLAQMLGVRRTSVTLAARRLQKAGIISYQRGKISIRDVDGLKSASCECYEAVKTHTKRLAMADVK